MKAFLTTILFCAFSQSCLAYDPIYRYERDRQTTNWQYYTRPGVVEPRKYVWRGEDNLFDVGDELNVVAEVITPKNSHITYDKYEAEGVVERELKAIGIRTDGVVYDGDKKKPFVHIQLLMHQMGNDVAVYASLRLFEPVCIDRCSIKCEQSWQVVTWEKQTLFVAPRNSLRSAVNSKVQMLADIFTRRWKHFDSLRPFKKEKKPKYREFVGSGQDPIDYGADTREGQILRARNQLFERIEREPAPSEEDVRDQVRDRQADDERNQNRQNFDEESGSLTIP